MTLDEAPSVGNWYTSSGMVIRLHGCWYLRESYTQTLSKHSPVPVNVNPTQPLHVGVS